MFFFNIMKILNWKIKRWCLNFIKYLIFLLDFSNGLCPHKMNLIIKYKKNKNHFIIKTKGVLARKVDLGVWPKGRTPRLWTNRWILIKKIKYFFFQKGWILIYGVDDVWSIWTNNTPYACNIFWSPEVSLVIENQV
jgi:hypothetical protein